MSVRKRRIKTLDGLIEILDELVSMAADARYSCVNTLAKDLQMLEHTATEAVNYALDLAETQTKVKK